MPGIRNVISTMGANGEEMLGPTCCSGITPIAAL